MLGTPYKFAQHGNGGIELSELLPHLAKVADDITLVRSMVTDQFNHAPAADVSQHRFGADRPAQHGLVADLGLGTENQNLPGFVVLLVRPERPRRRHVAAGAAAFCRAFIKACSSARKATRCCTSRIRRAWMPSAAAARSTRWAI